MMKGIGGWGGGLEDIGTALRILGGWESGGFWGLLDGDFWIGRMLEGWWEGWKDGWRLWTT